MEPLKPYERRSLLENRPQAQPGDVDRYERLLAARFEEDPDDRPAQAPVARAFFTAPTAEDELKELHEKLFGEDVPKPQPEAEEAL